MKTFTIIICCSVMFLYACRYDSRGDSRKEDSDHNQTIQFPESSTKKPVDNRASLPYRIQDFEQDAETPLGAQDDNNLWSSYQSSASSAKKSRRYQTTEDRMYQSYNNMANTENRMYQSYSNMANTENRMYQSYNNMANTENRMFQSYNNMANTENRMYQSQINMYKNQGSGF